MNRLGKRILGGLALLGAAAPGVLGWAPIHTLLFPLVIAVGALAATRLIARRDLRGLAGRLKDALSEPPADALTDEATGLHTRTFFDEALRLEVARTLRAGTGMGLLALALDHPARLNETHGGDVAGPVLAGMAERLRRAVRACDVVAHHGNGDLMVLLPGADEETLVEIGERCRTALGQLHVIADTGVSVEATVSVGGALLPVHADNSTDLIRVADRALLTAAAAGDRVAVGGAHAPDTPAGLLELGGALRLMESLAESVEGGASGPDHALRTAELARRVARHLDLEPEVTWSCVAAARVHDVGKVRVPESILRKPGPLTDDEWTVIRHHPGWGAEIVGLRPELASVARAVREHHERFDGAGYPMGRHGEEICIQARVVAVCDAWAAMRSHRPYRDALPVETAEAELRAGAAGQFDPRVVDAFLAVVADAGAVAA
jgi:diguanylate cyclase (GGDEF)-like protein